MSGRSRLEPKNHIPGEWNIILLHRYLPLSNGDRDWSSPANLVQDAKDLYNQGMTQIEIAERLNVSRAIVNYWKHKNWQVSARGTKE